MPALDIFISPIPGFEGDIPFPTILVSTWSPSGGSVSDLSAEANAGVLRTRDGKCKAAVNSTFEKKAKKATGKFAGGIRRNESAPKTAPAPSPPLGPRKKILIHGSNRYTYSWLPYFLDQSMTGEPPCRVPKDINPDSSTKSVPMSGESLKADKPRLLTLRS
jgi:hypothetical protein